MIVSALDGDFMRRPFGKIHELIPLADEVLKLTAICKDCGDDAPFTYRTTKTMEL